MPPYTAAFLTRLSADFLLAFLILALLISYAAAGLASRLARGLAFAASAVLCAVAKVSCFNGLDMFHGNASKIILLIKYITTYSACQEKEISFCNLL